MLVILDLMINLRTKPAQPTDNRSIVFDRVGGEGGFRSIFLVLIYIDGIVLSRFLPEETSGARAANPPLQTACQTHVDLSEFTTHSQ